jgi:hypothetical protein
MSNKTVQVTGLKETMRALAKLPEKSIKKVIKSAVGKAATAVAKVGRKFAPVGTGLDPDGQPRQHLNATIARSTPKVRKGSVISVAGPKAKAAPHAFLVDLGTKPHDITLTKPWGYLPAGFVIHHPGAKASHFMERAGESAGPAAAKKLEESIAKGIEKEASKLASKKK